MAKICKFLAILCAFFVNIVRSREIREISRESGGKGQGKQPWGVGRSASRPISSPSPLIQRAGSPSPLRRLLYSALVVLAVGRCQRWEGRRDLLHRRRSRSGWSGFNRTTFSRLIMKFIIVIILFIIIQLINVGVPFISAANNHVTACSS